AHLRKIKLWRPPHLYGTESISRVTQVPQSISCKKREPSNLQFELVANIVSWDAVNLSQLHRIHANNLSRKRR
ncbi:hypothetical protein, partial [Pseudomonas syringae]|uniref:hypothetical protein n=1 Tax=Pseudomonas syringae TaxID=317 RepID=UPI001C1FFA06